MTYPNARAALQQYRQVKTVAVTEGLPPKQLTKMLLESAQERLVAAKGHMSRREIAAKGQEIGRVVAIVDELRMSLNHEAGGELAANLDALYDYSQKRLTEANLGNDPALLDEVATLLREVKVAWDAICEDSPAVPDAGSS